ncbi:SgcJ/EcaC family oxidoreductase [Peribacillus muralis]|uniref:SgcJ/EcaC family oxidoreductase n=1 Tax=Peribacillus muralis TaxID=264697 RepID=UPI001F4EA4D8|nr:SgcJ/EcaC family oxidoreductase [Peribacillus muralis]MCK1995166.1 SgcJ/EcaC family oxidoreductase [Peribacillus muralis]MCK2015751.1 SgcJ/EcaC family oxidoreductase [Peribacillus muralis]
MSNKTEDYNSREDRQEEIAIRQTIIEMETAFNQHDADDLDRHFTQNAVWVNVIGVQLSGWKQINETHKVILAGPLRNSYARYTVDSIIFVRPDVAIVHIRQYPTTSEGKIIENGQGSLAIYVMVKEQGTWLIVAGQNTLVQETPR